VGIDVAEPNAFERLDTIAIERAARRWLSPQERAWCADQPCFRQAMVTVLSCKESVFKAIGGSVPVQDLTVAMDGRWPQGWARSAGDSPEKVTLWWEATSGHILTVAIAGRVGPARRLLNRIVRGRRSAETFLKRRCDTLHFRQTAADPATSSGAVAGRKCRRGMVFVALAPIPRHDQHPPGWRPPRS
jgi:hypothetical protein